MEFQEEETLKHWRARNYFPIVAVLALAFSVAGNAQQQQQLMTKVKIGHPAPDFTLPDHTGKQVKLSDFRGKKNVVLAFYVLAFTAG